MVTLSPAELQSLARAARLTLPRDAQERVVNKLEAVLSYAELLGTVEKPHSDYPQHEQLRTLRADLTNPSIPEQLLRLAPHVEERYFIVPVIIGGK